MRLFIFVLMACSATACGGPGANGPERTPDAEKWFTRASKSYKAGDFDDASDAIKHALQVAPHDTEVRALAGRAALTRLDFDEALKVTAGLQTSEVHGIRGRAFWYNGDLEHAADELEALLQDPEVRDPWARDVAKLARRGNGRHPFAIEGGIIGAVDMPRTVGQNFVGSANVVPCELDGASILALVATGTSEVVIDSSSRRDPTWVSLRFGNRVEVKDVPALTQDLSPLSRQLGVSIKALLGVNLLRHTHATFDRRGDQFILRKAESSAPPGASRLPVSYIRGGGMTMRVALNTKKEDEASLFVDSARLLPVALKDEGFQKAGVELRTLTPVTEAPGLKRGLVPTFKLAGFDLNQMPAVQGLDLNELDANTDVSLAGVIGADLLSFFRVTFADEGKFVWLEVDPTIVAPKTISARAPAPEAGSASPESATSAPPGSSATPSGNPPAPNKGSNKPPAKPANPATPPPPAPPPSGGKR